MSLAMTKTRPTGMAQSEKKTFDTVAKSPRELPVYVVHS